MIILSLLFFRFNLLICVIIVFCVFVMICLPNCEIFSLQLRMSVLFNLSCLLSIVVFFVMLRMNNVTVVTRLVNDIQQFYSNFSCRINISLISEFYTISIDPQFEEEMTNMWISSPYCTIEKQRFM